MKSSSFKLLVLLATCRHYWSFLFVKPFMEKLFSYFLAINCNLSDCHIVSINSLSHKEKFLFKYQREIISDIKNLFRACLNMSLLEFPSVFAYFFFCFLFMLFVMKQTRYLNLRRHLVQLERQGEEEDKP